MDDFGLVATGIIVCCATAIYIISIIAFNILKHNEGMDTKIWTTFRTFKAYYEINSNRFILYKYEPAFVPTGGDSSRSIDIHFSYIDYIRYKHWRKLIMKKKEAQRKKEMRNKPRAVDDLFNEIMRQDMQIYASQNHMFDKE